MPDCNHEYNLSSSEIQKDMFNKSSSTSAIKITNVDPIIRNYDGYEEKAISTTVNNYKEYLKVLSVSIIEKKNKKYMKASLITYGENMPYSIGDYIDIAGCQFKIKKIEYTDNSIILEAKSKFNLGIDYISKVKNMYIQK